MDLIVIAVAGFFVGAVTIISLVARPLVKENRRLQRELGELDKKYSTEVFLAADRIMNDEH